MKNIRRTIAVILAMASVMAAVLTGCGELQAGDNFSGQTIAGGSQCRPHGKR